MFPGMFKYFIPRTLKLPPPPLGTAQGWLVLAGAHQGRGMSHLQDVLDNKD